MAEASLLKGMCFSFDVDENQFNVRFSALTGKEQLFVNGQLVHEQRKFNTRTGLTTVVEGRIYTVEVVIESIASTVVECNFFESDVLIQKQKATISLSNRTGILLFLLSLFCVFFGVDHLTAIYGLDQKIRMVIIMLAIVFLSFLFTPFIGKIKIEDIPVS